MGLLTVGDPIEWYDLKRSLYYVKQHGILQFINLYAMTKQRRMPCLRWGDEIEYLMVKFDDEHRKVRLSLRAADVLARLTCSEKKEPTENEFLWRPEYAAYMIEGTPGCPYGMLCSFTSVEENMRRRRIEATKMLGPDEFLLTIGNFPRLGCDDFSDPPALPTPDAGVSRSLFFPDRAIFAAHPRFANLTRNIRERRGCKVAINVPIFRDENTPRPFLEDFSRFRQQYGPQAVEAAKPDHIYMDAMGFGMGCCCLQVTFQAVDVEEARWLYDQLTPITPILLALSASTPIFRGYLADVDCRWDVISASVDDRTPEEQGLRPLKEDKFVIAKSRYDTTDLYLHPCNGQYNDVDLQYDPATFSLLVNSGVDHLLARHVAHMFIRDPLQVYHGRVEQDDKTSSEHFETVQSSNWLNMRFKPPPLDNPSIGWRVEFRPTEVQLTDFENAAYVCFVVLLTRVMLSYHIIFTIPISKVDENMKRAQKRDAVLNERFYFRKALSTCESPPEVKRICPCHAAAVDGAVGGDVQTDADCCDEAEVVEMTVNEIMNGKPPEFPGLIRLIRTYLDSAELDVKTSCSIQRYLKFMEKRASGELFTLARWMREFVRQHPEYHKDSVVSESICYDMLKKMKSIADRNDYCCKLLGDFYRQNSNSGT